MSHHPNYEIPAELNNLLIDFTVSVLVNRPGDLIEYAANYFNRLLDERRNSAPSNHSLQSNHCNEDDNDSTSSDISMFFIHHFFCTSCYQLTN